MIHENRMLVSVVIPVFNEAEVLGPLLERLRPVLDSLGHETEVIFVNDGSGDDSLSMLTTLSRNDPRIKVIGLCRNFGHQAAITAGLDFAGGDAVVMMDADLQDPPELIPQMLSLYEQGYDVVSAQRTSRVGDSWFKKGTAAMFYWIMQHMVDKRLQRQVGDFRLISRPALQAIRAFREQHRFMRGLIAWLGLKETIVPFEREARAGGHTKYPLSKMLRFSWTAITSFSALPLRLSTCLGVTFSLLSFGYFLFAVWAALVWRSVVPGWTSLVAIQCFLFGVLFLCMGMIGDYIAKIYEEVKGRPLYIVNETRNLLRAPEISRALVLHDGEPERAEQQEAASPAAAGKLH